MVWFDFVYRAVLRCVTCDDSDVVVIGVLLYTFGGGRKSFHIKTNSVVISIISTRPYVSHILSLPPLILLPLLLGLMLLLVSCRLLLMLLLLAVVTHVSHGILRFVYRLRNIPSQPRTSSVRHCLMLRYHRCIWEKMRVVSPRMWIMVWLSGWAMCSQVVNLVPTGVTVVEVVVFF